MDTGNAWGPTAAAEEEKVKVDAVVTALVSRLGAEVN